MTDRVRVTSGSVSFRLISESGLYTHEPAEPQSLIWVIRLSVDSGISKGLRNLFEMISDLFRLCAVRYQIRDPDVFLAC